jgi:hypothetical protein
LYEAYKEAKTNDSDIRQQVRRIGNQCLSHVEIGAQEAAYLVLQMHISLGRLLYLLKALSDSIFVELSDISFKSENGFNNTVRIIIFY